MCLKVCRPVSPSALKKTGSTSPPPCLVMGGKEEGGGGRQVMASSTHLPLITGEARQVTGKCGSAYLNTLRLLNLTILKISLIIPTFKSHLFNFCLYIIIYLLID